MKFIDMIKKGDILLVVFLIVTCVFLFLPKGEKDKLRVEIFLDGECVEQRVLSQLDKDEKITVAGCEILLQKDGVTFVDSDCFDSLCEKRGKMTACGDAMACVPQRVIVVLSEEKAADFDSVVY